MSRPGDPRDVWVDVDASHDPQLCVDFLDAFNSTPWLRAHKMRAFDFFGPQPQGTFLEVGCGTGTDALAFARRLVGGKVIGVDPSRTMIGAAARRAEGAGLPIEFQCGSAYALPFADNSFDAVCSLMTFDILEHPLRALQEMVRVTRPGGQVLVSASDHGSLVIDAPERRLTRLLIESFCDSMHSGWAGRQLPAHFAKCGLQQLGVVPDTVTLHAADFALARQIILENMVRAAQARALVSEAEGLAWLASLDAAYRAGHFFAASTFFVVSGVK
jgi:ubiquinone/menaquinone biosynthesis C-methylase UbiE